jgi:hypothetical protein
MPSDEAIFRGYTLVFVICKAGHFAVYHAVFQDDEHFLLEAPLSSRPQAAASAQPERECEVARESAPAFAVRTLLLRQDAGAMASIWEDSGSHALVCALLAPLEVETLLAASDRAASGGKPELVLVSDYSGVCKSGVVNGRPMALVPPRGLRARLVQPAGSLHPHAEGSQANFRRISCTRLNLLLVRLIRGKSFQCQPQMGQDFPRGVPGLRHSTRLGEQFAPRHRGASVEKSQPRGGIKC